MGSLQESYMRTRDSPGTLDLKHITGLDWISLTIEREEERFYLLEYFIDTMWLSHNAGESEAYIFSIGLISDPVLQIAACNISYHSIIFRSA